MFHDEAEVFVQAGKGGDGIVSFRREKYVPRGGPDGGNGGRGGDVVLVADPTITSLRHLRQRVHVRAEKGRAGQGANKVGRCGAHETIRVPCGTIVRDRDTGLLLRDLTRAGERIVAARGGKAGKGNKHFATSTNRVPREFTSGEKGEERWLKVELKLIADVGLIGFPNAGKSTFLSRVSAARPKVADYPFTTLQPSLGLVELSDHRTLVIADVPGLIEGAHEGKGLGRRFLRHLERTRALLFLLDPIDPASPEPVEAYRVLSREVERFDPEMAAKPRIVAASKSDLWGDEDHAARLRESLGVEVFPLCAPTGDGLSTLMTRLVSVALDEDSDA